MKWECDLSFNPEAYNIGVWMNYSHYCAPRDVSFNVFQHIGYSVILRMYVRSVLKCSCLLMSMSDWLVQKVCGLIC